MRKIIGIGETILDIIFRNNQPSHAVPGGSTFNTLISLGRLGVPATFISEIGKDTVGDIIIDFMKKNGVCTENLEKWRLYRESGYFLRRENTHLAGFPRRE